MRRHNDAYYSQAWVVDALLKHVDLDLSYKIVEPSCGSGVIYDRLLEIGPTKKITTADIVEGLGDYTMDFFEPKQPAPLYKNCDWIITNPPYKCGKLKASDYVRLAMKRSRRGVALFLRMSFLEPCNDRADLLTETVCGMTLSTVISCPRVSFTGDGKTDSVSCGWFVWERRPKTKFKTLHVFTKEQRDEIS